MAKADLSLPSPKKPRSQPIPTSNCSGNGAPCRPRRVWTFRVSLGEDKNTKLPANSRRLMEDVAVREEGWSAGVGKGKRTKMAFRTGRRWQLVAIRECVCPRSSRFLRAVLACLIELKPAGVVCVDGASAGKPSQQSFDRCNRALSPCVFVRCLARPGCPAHRRIWGSFLPSRQELWIPCQQPDDDRSTAQSTVFLFSGAESTPMP